MPSLCNWSCRFAFRKLSSVPVNQMPSRASDSDNGGDSVRVSTQGQKSQERNKLRPEHLLLCNEKWRHNDVTPLDVMKRERGSLN